MSDTSKMVYYCEKNDLVSWVNIYIQSQNRSKSCPIGKTGKLSKKGWIVDPDRLILGGNVGN